KFEAFGFEAIRIDGNNLDQLYDVLTKQATEKPIAIILDTVKGKGIKEVEETMNNHSMAMSTEVYDKWLEQLRSELAALA
ncbi:MAG: transketolase, partial [Oscillospiraceae bacterium]